MVRWVAELLARGQTRLDRAHRIESPEKVDPQVLENLLEEFKELFPDSLLGLSQDRVVQVSIPLMEGAKAVR